MENKLKFKDKLLDEAISPYEQYCDGYGSPGASGKAYITGIVLEVGVTDITHSHDGSIILDSILAFDKAEVETVNIGQINMITVSSFCGLSGLIWGYDIVKHTLLENFHPCFIDGFVLNGQKEKIPVYSAVPLKEATYRLFGPVSKKRFPLLPGSHVPCAGKHISIKGPKHIYAGLAFGIAKNRERDACLFMEDIGEMEFGMNDCDKLNKKNEILKSLANAVISIGKNQVVEYDKIFVDMVDVEIKENQIGCALVAAPYFSLAQKCIPNNDLDYLSSHNLYDWEKEVSRNFLD